MRYHHHRPAFLIAIAIAVTSCSSSPTPIARAMLSGAAAQQHPLQIDLTTLPYTATITRTALGSGDQQESEIACESPSNEGDGYIRGAISRGDVVEFEKGLTVRVNGPIPIPTSVPILIADPKTGLAAYFCGQDLSLK